MDEMNSMMIVSLIVFALSLLISSVKLFDWWLNSDPKAIVRAGRWSLALAAVAALAGLAWLLYQREWPWALLLAATLLVGVSLSGRGLKRPRFRFRPLWRDRVEGQDLVVREASDSGADAEEELAREAAAVLRAYLQQRQSGGPALQLVPNQDETKTAPKGALSDAEALAILGLGEGASALAVRDAHRRLTEALTGVQGGSEHLCLHVDRARDRLLFGDEPQVPGRAEPAG